MSSFERCYWFYQRLKNRKYPTKKQFLEAFEVNESTFKRDLAYMRDRLGAPIRYAPDANGYILTDSAFEIPSFWFNRTQLMLMVGISRQLQKMAGKTPGTELAAFRDRLRDLLTLSDGSDITECFSFEYVEWTLCDSAYLDLLLEAVMQRTCVNMTYHAAGTDETTDRTVEPYRLHNYMGTWYLIGFCRRHDAPRTFQVGRISSLDVTKETFAAPRFDVTAYVENAYGIFKGGAPTDVALRFDPFAARFVRKEIWHEKQTLTDTPDGGLVLTLPVSDIPEIKMKVLQFGGHVEVIKPDALRAEVVREARAILKTYDV